MRSFPIAAKFPIPVCFSLPVQILLWKQLGFRVPLQTTGSALSQNPKTLSETTSVGREHALLMLLLTMSALLMDGKEGDVALEISRSSVFFFPLFAFLMLLLTMSTLLMDEKRRPDVLKSRATQWFVLFYSVCRCLWAVCKTAIAVRHRHDCGERVFQNPPKKASHHGETDQRDQGLFTDGAAEGRAVREDQAQQGCGEVQGEVQEVPLYALCV